MGVTPSSEPRAYSSASCASQDRMGPPWQEEEQRPVLVLGSTNGPRCVPQGGPGRCGFLWKPLRGLRNTARRPRPLLNGQ